ncbi:uncharacterized protein At4g22758-like [Rhodamnia argentea]|uniref:Uncharacterized protein At4g22758-like n=1 Tax=Rhodamnia argentea TaxID=178133 RepID=A0ABM3HIN6_9MYRT|nr:uncharacterized protein At4g22758-like [Rhodamnia argentea]
MPTSKSHRTATEDRGRRGKLPKKASSFHGRVPPAIAAAKELARPMTAPELLPPASLPEPRPRLTKLLLNVTVLGSVGAVQVVMTPESTVGDLVAAVVRQYAKEGRRPALASDDPPPFDLHYSQFSLESLDREEKLMALGSRNFFVCPKKAIAGGPADSYGGCSAAATSSCSCEAQKAAKTGFNWLKFIDFLLQ